MKDSSRKNCFLTFSLIVLGIVFGILSKSGDVAIQGNIWGDMLRAFGYITSDFFIWVVICTRIAILSKTKFLSVINILVFLIAMLLTYYLYSYFIVGYLVLRVVKFWLIMLLPSAVLGCIIWNIKTSRILKYIMIIAGTFIMIIDIISQGLLPIAMIIYAILYAVFLITLLSKPKYFDKP